VNAYLTTVVINTNIIPVEKWLSPISGVSPRIPWKDPHGFSTESFYAATALVNNGVLQDFFGGDLGVTDRELIPILPLQTPPYAGSTYVNQFNVPDPLANLVVLSGTTNLKFTRYTHRANGITDRVGFSSRIDGFAGVQSRYSFFIKLDATAIGALSAICVYSPTGINNGLIYEPPPLPVGSAPQPLPAGCEIQPYPLSGNNSVIGGQFSSDGPTYRSDLRLVKDGIPRFIPDGSASIFVTPFASGPLVIYVKSCDWFRSVVGNPSLRVFINWFDRDIGGPFVPTQDIGTYPVTLLAGNQPGLGQTGLGYIALEVTFPVPAAPNANLKYYYTISYEWVGPNAAFVTESAGVYIGFRKIVTHSFVSPQVNIENGDYIPGLSILPG
jgi:hypothetical protein